MKLKREKLRHYWEWIEWISLLQDLYIYMCTGSVNNQKCWGAQNMCSNNFVTNLLTWQYSVISWCQLGRVDIWTAIGHSWMWMPFTCIRLMSPIFASEFISPSWCILAWWCLTKGECRYEHFSLLFLHYG